MKKGKDLFSNKSIVMVWMSSFIVLILITASAMLLSYNSAEKNMEKEVKRINEEFMTERMDYVDRYISSAMTGLLNISRIGELDTLRDSDLDGIKNEKVYEITKRINTVEIDGVNTEMRFVYFPKHNIIISSVVRTPEEYFKIINQNGEYDLWRENVLSPDGENTLYYDDENKVLYIRTKKHSNALGAPDSIIVIAVSMEDFAKSLGNGKNSDFIICTTDGKQILSASGKYYGDITEKLDYSSVIKSSFEGSYALSYETAVGFDWNYVCISDTSSYVRSFRTSRRIVILCVTAAAFLSLLLGYYFTKKNNRFIFELSDILKTDDSAQSGNEYAAIYKSVNKIIDDANKKDTILYRQDMKRRADLLSRTLLPGAEIATLTAELDGCGIKFEHDWFCTAELEITKYENIFFEENENITEAMRLAKYVTANVFGDLFNKMIKVYAVERADGVVLIINCQNNSIKEDVKKILDFGAAFVEENFNVFLRISVSAIRRGVESICKCYAQVRRAKDYRRVGFVGILDVEEMGNKLSVGSYYYPAGSEQKILADIKSGDYKKAEENICEIFRVNAERNTPPKLMTILAANIISVFLRAVNPPESNAAEFFAGFNDAYAAIESFESVNDVKERLLELAKFVCAFSARDEQTERRSTVEEIKKYVGEHYSDPMLNVNHIADWFNMKTSFLSTLFKRQEGMGLLEYITTLRLDEAKRLLKNTDYTMAVVAEKTGFMSERTFFRAFEKYVGISPGRFRKEG